MKKHVLYILFSYKCRTILLSVKKAVCREDICRIFYICYLIKFSLPPKSMREVVLTQPLQMWKLSWSILSHISKQEIWIQIQVNLTLSLCSFDKRVYFLQGKSKFLQSKRILFKQISSENAGCLQGYFQCL